jgi:diaminohydroxyphosphoribosylaminopyrimidine deaminase/5-amino-6-(5-phosphoribosylamino)uracil reductase
MANEAAMMRRALELAERGRGSVEPNPMVGAVLVRDGAVVGEGWHERFGGPHAEVLALRAAGERACGATLYVTLEPCNHFGKTPPCVDAVLAAGVARVVVAMADPYPEVAGAGLARLRDRGVTVETGLLEAEAERLNRPYLTLVRTGRPYVHLKWAMSLDGKSATRTGDSHWISNAKSRALVHTLRGRMDAIVVGSGTVRADDPLLTARPPGPRVPARVVVSGRPALPEGCQLLRTAAESPVILATTAAAEIPGVEVLPLPGRPDVTALLAELGRRRFTNVLVEGGAALAGSFLDAALVDEVHAFVAPLLVGGPHAAVGGAGFATIGESVRLTTVESVPLDGDVYIRAIVDQK